MKQRCRHRQGGFALVLVMLLVAMAVVLGLSYLSSATVRLASSDNLAHAARARYLAESALQHGLHVLKTTRNPQPVQMGPFHADDSDDTYWLSIESAGDSVWQVRGHGRSGQIAQETSALVRCSPPTVRMDRAAYIGGGSTALPPSVRINGSIHLNGSLSNLAYINGDVSAVGLLIDFLLRISGTRTAFAPEREPLELTAGDYQTYYIGGMPFHAAQVVSNTFNKNHALAGGRAVSVDNPGGVVFIRPSSGTRVTIGTKTDFTGTLVVLGDLALDGQNISFQAMDGFPAVIVTGRVYVVGNARAEFEGLVIARQGFSPSGSTGSSRTIINGGLHCDERGYDMTLGGYHEMNHIASRCRLLDVRDQDGLPVLDVMAWLD